MYCDGTSANVENSCTENKLLTRCERAFARPCMCVTTCGRVGRETNVRDTPRSAYCSQRYFGCSSCSLSSCEILEKMSVYSAETDAPWNQCMLGKLEEGKRPAVILFLHHGLRGGDFLWNDVSLSEQRLEVHLFWELFRAFSPDCWGFRLLLYLLMEMFQTRMFNHRSEWTSANELEAD